MLTNMYSPAIERPRPRVADITHDHLRIEIVGELRNELTLDRQLLIHQREIVLQLAVVGDDDALAEGVELWTTSAPEHLKYILTREFRPPTLLWVVDLRALDDNGVRRKVDTPSERCRTDENVNMTGGEKVLDEYSIFTDACQRDGWQIRTAEGRVNADLGLDRLPRQGFHGSQSLA